MEQVTKVEYSYIKGYSSNSDFSLSIRVTTLSYLVLKMGCQIMRLSPAYIQALKRVQFPWMVRPLVVIVPDPGLGQYEITLSGATTSSSSFYSFSSFLLAFLETYTGLETPSLNFSFPIFHPVLIILKELKYYLCTQNHFGINQTIAQFIKIIQSLISLLMGNSKESNQIDQYNHPRLGNIKRIQQANGSQYMGYEIVLQNQKVYEEWEKQLRWIKNQQSVDEILFLPSEYVYKQTSFCGTGGIASLKYQDYLYSLLLQIINRRQIKRPFNEQELLYLFYSLVKISAILQKKNRIIGDIKPENILVNQQGYVKIISQFSWPGQPHKLARTWDKSNERLLLSPEQCEQRMKRKPAVTFNPQDSCSQAFSIGLTILEAGTLRNCSQVYGSSYQYKLNQLKIREYLDIFQDRYSKPFAEMVREMLHLNPRKRWKAQQIYKILKPYQYQIMNLEQIGIKVDSANSLPRFEREEKISIKKIGQSHFSSSSKKNNNENNRQSKMVQSPQNIKPLIPSNQSNSQSLQMNGSGYHMDSFPNHQMIKEHTNFGRQLAPQPFVQYRPHQFMASSLPLNPSFKSRDNGPQYITQNSMFNPVGKPLFDTTYALGNTRKQFY